MKTFYFYPDDPFSQRARLALAYALQEVSDLAVVMCPLASSADLPEAHKERDVPFLILDDEVLENSLEIMDWALDNIPEYTWTDWDLDQMDDSLYLIELADRPFHDMTETLLHAESLEEVDAAQTMAGGFLRQLDGLLMESVFLLQDTPLLVDYAIFPFIHRFKEHNTRFWDTLPHTYIKYWYKKMMETQICAQVYG